MKINIDVSGVNETVRALKSTPEKLEKVRDRTFGRMRTRIVSVTTDAVSKKYKIKRGLYREAVSNSVKINSGKLQAIFKGGLLTPARFSHTPTSPPGLTKTGKRKKYKATATFFIGNKKKLNPLPGIDGKMKSVFIAPTGAGSESKIQFTFFTRTGRMKNNKKRGYKTEQITPFKTLAIPQMILNEQVEAEIKMELADFFVKRFNHEAENVLRSGKK